MKRFVILSALLVLAVGSIVAHRVYKGTYRSYTDIVYTYDDRHIYSGTTKSYTDIVYTYDDRHIYRGTSTSYTDIVYTFD